jgi:hypothetical protein
VLTMLARVLLPATHVGHRRAPFLFPDGTSDDRLRGAE